MENFNIGNPAITGKHEPMARANTPNEDQEHPAKRPFWMVARDILAKFKAPAFGLPSLDHYIYGWKRSANIVIAGRPGMGASDLALTLAEKFASNVGPVIWLGVGGDLRSITERLLLRDAGIEICDANTIICLDDAGKQALTRAKERIGSLPIEFCNLDQCDDADLVQEFLVQVTSDLPTLIVVEPSAFGDSNLDPFDVLVRRCNLFKMIDELKKSNRDWHLLWQVPVSVDLNQGDGNSPSIDDLDEPTVTGSADVVMFAHRDLGQSDVSVSTNAELIIVKNCFGSTGTIPLHYYPAFSTWRDFSAID